MKKVFLLFGIAAFSSASAQQKDLFDIQKHIQEKIGKDREKVEKNVLKAGKNVLRRFENCWGTSMIQKPYSKKIPVFILPNGDKVISLPTYNMPCVQPDMRQFQTMPNVAYDKQFNFSPHRPKPGQIPNGAGHYKMIGSK